MSIATTMKAAVTCNDALKVVVREIPVPEIEPNQVLVKVEAAAGNPTDWKSMRLVQTDGNVVGCDFAGTVVRIGSDVSPEQAKVGDRVAGLVQGAAYPNGAFAEYTAANADLVVPIPENWSFAEAAQIGIAMYTACAALFYANQFPAEPSDSSSPATLPASDFDPERTVLIWGGSTSVGQAVIQVARIVGLRVITTASEARFELMRSLGVAEVFDYNKADTPAKIKELTKNGLKHVVDCISEGETPSQVAQAVGDQGGKVAVTLPCKSLRPDVENVPLFLFHVLGKDMTIPFVKALDIGQYEARIVSNKVIRKVLKSGAYRPSEIDILPNGLESVNDGLELLRQKKVQAKKLIYKISDTSGLKSD